MKLYSNASEYLNYIVSVIRDIVMIHKLFDFACSVVIFGSAARPNDFIIGVSDVDVLILTRNKPDKWIYNFDIAESRVNAVVFMVDDFKRLIELGHPLIFMLKYHIVIRDDGCFKNLIKIKPKITSYTRRVLRKSIFAALGLALENYLIFRDYKFAISHLVHCIRHLARYLCSFKDLFPVSDEEICNCIGGEFRKLFIEISNLRRKCEIDSYKLKIMFSRVLNLIADKLNLKATSLASLESIVSRGAHLICAGEVDGYMAFRIEVFNGDRRKVFEIFNDKVREVDSIFF